MTTPGLGNKQWNKQRIKLGEIPGVPIFDYVFAGFREIHFPNIPAMRLGV